jgi:hypothetical protein
VLAYCLYQIHFTSVSIECVAKNCDVSFIMNVMLVVSFCLTLLLANCVFSTESSGCWTVEFRGRMGNLMFEYASLIGICIYRGFEPFSCAHMKNLKMNTMDLPVAEFINVFQLPLNSSLTCEISHHEVEHEKSCSFDKKLLEVLPGTVIHGYLQSWKYFHPHGESVIRKMFELPEQVTAKAERLLASIRKKLPPDFKVIGVHIRRGDKVVHNQYEEVYDQWALSEDYYRRAIQLLTRRHPRCALLFFTGGGTSPDVLHNDRAWVMDHFGNFSHTKLGRVKTPVFFDESEDHFVSFKALSLCDAIVVAHSSFSWWSAYLSTSTMEVVAPYHMFSKSFLNKCSFVSGDYNLPWWSLIAHNSSLDRIIAYNNISSIYASSRKDVL